MPEVVLELKVNAGFVHGRIGKHGFVNVTIGHEHVLASGLGDEYFHGEWLVDLAGFSDDGVDGGVFNTALMEAFECFDDELRWLVLDGN